MNNAVLMLLSVSVSGSVLALLLLLLKPLLRIEYQKRFRITSGFWYCCALCSLLAISSAFREYRRYLPMQAHIAI